MADFSPRFRFSDWRNSPVPLISAGNYVIWQGTELLYSGMAGRQFDPEKAGGRLKYGLYTRLASHASGRLSGDQFCVYVANRLIMPTTLPPAARLEHAMHAERSRSRRPNCRVNVNQAG
jgi:hypothetical protein